MLGVAALEERKEQRREGRRERVLAARKEGIKVLGP